jgi:BlaI family transcriptional regulator, penicillinase repressor
MADPKQITKRELDLMAVVWARGSATVAEVHQQLSDLAYSTVLTILRTLEHKGYVRHVQEGKAFRYFPLIQPEDVGATALRRILNKVYRGSRELLIQHLVAGEDISREELERIRDRLDARLEELDS